MEETEGGAPMIKEYRFRTITTAGADGSATGEDTSDYPIAGRFLSVNIAYSAGQENTCDVTIATVHTPVRTILTKSDNDTSLWVDPRHKVQDETGADVTYDGTNEVYEPVPVCDYIKVSVAGADNGETVDVTILYEE